MVRSALVLLVMLAILSLHADQLVAPRFNPLYVISQNLPGDLRIHDNLFSGQCGRLLQIPSKPQPILPTLPRELTILTASDCLCLNRKTRLFEWRFQCLLCLVNERHETIVSM